MNTQQNMVKYLSLPEASASKNISGSADLKALRAFLLKKFSSVKSRFGWGDQEMRFASDKWDVNGPRKMKRVKFPEMGLRL